MEERKFVIKECPTGGDTHNFSIPESELKQRYLVASNARVTDEEWYRIRNILLHGEIEKHYIIREWGQDDPPKGWDVTEDELNKRWKIIRTLIYMHVDDKDLTNALLNGEQKEKP